MIRLFRSIILCMFILPLFTLNGQNTYLNKKVNLPTGQVTLKVALNSISNQTGCVFSYDPTKITDKQLLSITAKGSQSVSSALFEILPKNIQFKPNGKYIVLQEVDNKTISKQETSITIQLKQNKSVIQGTKHAGRIDKDPNLESLVLPPLVNNSETSVIKKQVDSADIIQNVVSVQQKDSNQLVTISADTISEKPEPAVSRIALNNKTDTTKTTKYGFSDFIKKNCFLESGISINNQLAMLSIHAGLSYFYSTFSIGSDYHDSYLFGIGAGTNVKIDKHFSLNFELLQNSLVAGKSYSLQVRASNTQFSPVLNYLFGRSFKVFGGPTLNLIKSSYISSISSTDLGVLVGVGFTFGLKIDLKNLLIKQILVVQ